MSRRCTFICDVLISAGIVLLFYLVVLSFFQLAKLGSAPPKPVPAPEAVSAPKAVGSVEMPERIPRPPTLPDLKLTPGKVSAGWTLADTKAAGGTQGHRNVSDSLKKQVWERYGYDKTIGPYEDHASEYEIDHRCPVCLGGASVVENLWPQPYDGPFNAHMKDKLEVHVRAEVIVGTLTLKQGQDIFFGDWIDAYRKLQLDEQQ
jgi:hypothetical protein